MRRIAGFAVWVLWAGMALAADPSASLSSRKAQAAAQRQQLRERIESIQKKIDQQEASRRDAASDLKASESAISTINRRLAALAVQERDIKSDLRGINAKTAQQHALLSHSQAQLADQLRAEYASGLSPWTALLSGDDPQAIGRDLGYLGYVSQARADTVRAIRQAIDALAALRRQSQEQARQLAQVSSQTAKQKADLQAQEKERQHVLARIEAQLKRQRAQAGRLEQNEKSLGGLIGSLDKAIAEQAEAARRAEEKRKAEEAARKARAARERQARQSEERKRQAQEQQQEQQAREHQQAQERQQARAEKEAPAARRAAPPESAPAAMPKGGFRGLSKGLPYPVDGEIQGRFGADRPDGGVWRGIVLRAPAGTAVHAIAAGRVVYANWLTGFGNIMIVDHGQGYLSIYAYNQSLLKRVGDIVGAGDVIATVGSTGGQVETGLYFEIRHKGTPVNPLLWLKH